MRLAALLAALALAIPPVAAAKSVRVMTRNLYLGADLTPAITATSVPALATAVGQIWGKVQTTDFPARAKVLAAEIKKAKPDLIGLQEAAMWRTQTPADGPPVLGGTPATTVVYDFLGSLLAELDAVKAPYDIVRVQQEADLEAPAFYPPLFDVRLTQRDVILARRKFANKATLSNAQSANYLNNLSFGLAGLACPPVCVTSTRGWTSVDVDLKGDTFRFVNTHLEAFSAGYRAQQAVELATATPASTTAMTVVLVGDLNSDPLDGSVSSPDPTPNNTAVNLLTGMFGYVDTWTQVNPSDPGLTDGFSELLTDADASVFTKRIDHILTRPEIRVSRAYLVGIDPRNRTPAGLWPSDHAGVVTKAAFPRDDSEFLSRGAPR